MKKAIPLILVLILILCALVACKEDKHEHSFGDWSTTKNATCIEDGVKTRYCDCGEKQTDTIPADGHKEEVLPAKEATCTETGLTEGKKCSSCGEILVEQEIINKKPHTEEIIPRVDPTCTETGLTEGKKCSVCKTVIEKQETIPALDHDKRTYTEKDENCNVYNVTVCDRENCNYTDRVATGVENHAFGDWERVNDNITGSPCGIDKIYKRICTDCGATEDKVEPTPTHNYKTTVISVHNYDSTTDVATIGEIKYECQNDGCDSTYYEYEYHEYTQKVISSTCSEQGYTLNTCFCGHSYKSDFTEKLPHTPGVEATCTTSQICTECKTILKPALVHDWKDATCTKPKTCQRAGCGTTDGEAKGHTPSASIQENVVEATCTEDGSYDEVVYCDIEKCKTEISREKKTISALGHVFVEGSCNCGAVEYTIWDGTIASSFDGGSGTEDDPYLISTGAQLAYLASAINGSNSNTFYDKHYKLINSINLNGFEWDPIGCYYTSDSSSVDKRSFWGIFDGNGYRIYNFKITEPQKSYYKYFGLFGLAQNATVKNLGVTDFIIDLEGYVESVGGVAGSFMATSYADGTLLYYCTVINSFATGDIILKIDNRSSCSVGGFAGTLFGNTSDCYSNVDINVVNVNDGWVNVGGLSGSGGGFIFTSYAEGNIIIEADGNTNIGGLVGQFGLQQNNISNCRSSVFIDCKSINDPYSVTVNAGGLLGDINLNDNNANLDLSNSYALGSVNISCDNINASGSYDSSTVYSGGLVGDNSYNRNVVISSCFAEGDVNVICIGNEDVRVYVGGFIGHSSGGIVKNCYSHGSVNAESSGLTDVMTYAGGFLGSASFEMEITNCYSVGDTKVESNATMEEHVYFSGFVGSVGTTRSVIKNCYCSGNATASSSAEASSYIHYGKIINDGGYVTVDNVYYYEGQKITYEGGTSLYQNRDGIACSLSQLNSESFYASTLGWDNTIWYFSCVDFVESVYPALK